MQIKALVLDWGDTVMRDYPDEAGAMVTWAKVEAIPGADVALGHFSKYFYCFLASNAGDSNSVLMGKALERVGIRQYFHHLFTSKELGASKPSPEFFRGVVRELELQPCECVMIGNDYYKDIVGAKNVGMRTIWFCESKVVQSKNTSADTVITDMKELIQAVSALNENQ
ncbi:HAD family hydrolase [Alicyclobacillus fodiniaquatilis]|uniref:HAD family hydrolase n=1 Tax=Alicyclobacillus fodiniaquatilis TaxID=1661150 RepID=A0ABW4JNH8_9BACL